MPAIAVILTNIFSKYICFSFLPSCYIEIYKFELCIQYYMLASLNFMSLLFTISLNVLQKHDLNSLIEYTIFDYMAMP